MGVSVYCGKCGKFVDEVPNIAEETREPCPECGSLSRRLEASLSDGVGVSDHGSASLETQGRVTGFRESTRQGRAATADQNQDGSLTYTLNGSSPQGEEDTLAACRILVDTLNQDHANWDAPAIADEPADCQAHDRQSPEHVLRIQVVRAIVDPNLWKSLNLAGRIEETDISKQELVVQIKSAIEAKANDRKIPQQSRQGLVLALDATRLPVLCFDAVFEEFHSKWGSWAGTLGFDMVWLVGPNNSLTWRLDTKSGDIQGKV